MKSKPKILAFAGSLRADSFNKKLIKIAMQGAQEAGGEITHIDLLDFPLPIYNEDIETKEGLPSNAIKLKELMWSHDGFLISSPEYNSSVPGVLKNVIDWTSRKATPEEVYLSCFIGKVAGLTSASPSNLGGVRGLAHLRSILQNINMLVIPNQKCVSNASQAFQADGSLKDPKMQEDVKKVGRKLTEILAKFAN